MCRLGWAAIHHIPRAEALQQAGGQAACSSLHQGSRGHGLVDQFRESRSAPAGPHCWLCARAGSPVSEGPPPSHGAAVPGVGLPLATHFSMSLFLQVFLHGLLFAALTGVKRRMASLLGQTEDSHSGQTGSTDERPGLNQWPPPSAPANLGQDLPSLAHLERTQV